MLSEEQIAEQLRTPEDEAKLLAAELHMKAVRINQMRAADG